MGAYKHAKTGCSTLPLLPPFTSGQYLCLRGRPRAGRSPPVRHKRAQKSPTDRALLAAAGDTVAHHRHRGRRLRGTAALTAATPRGARPRRETLRLRAGGRTALRGKRQQGPGRHSLGEGQAAAAAEVSALSGAAAPLTSSPSPRCRP